jgi:hypothetical protein
VKKNIAIAVFAILWLASMWREGQWFQLVRELQITPGSHWRMYRNEPGYFTTVKKVEGDRVTYAWISGDVEDTKENFLRAWPYPGTIPSPKSR